MKSLLGALLVVLLSVAGGVSAEETNSSVSLPMDRTAYFVGEKALISVTGSRPVKVELAGEDRRLLVHQGPAGTLVLDTVRLLPGKYEIALDGAGTGRMIYVVPIERASMGVLADEAHPGPLPAPTAEEKKDPALRAANHAKLSDTLDEHNRRLGMTAAMQMMSAGTGRNTILDVLARSGVMSFNNPETRPTSFVPVANDPVERDGLTQRMMLSAQAQGRYPTFGGFCVAFDSSGFQPGNRRSLLVYWKWNNQTEALKQYIEKYDRILTDEFKSRTGYEWVRPEEYIHYTLSIGRTDMAPAIDLPTQRWLDQTSSNMKPMSEGERAAFEKRLDAWADWLMSQYPSTYAQYMKQLRGFDPSMRHTGSVQIDHAPVIQGQYLPPAYGQLDFRYQSTWNDQFAAPDYIYQGLFTAGMLDTERPDGQPVWVSNAHGLAHGRSPSTGKFTRVAAQILPHGGSGVGNAFEAFSTMLGGMIGAGKGDAILDVQSGREFAQRFAALGLEGRGDYGVGILLSKTQFSRQYVCLAYGTPQFRAFVSLTKMGYTPVFLTDDEVAAGRFRGVKSLVIFGQTVPLPERVLGSIKSFAASGGAVIRDGGTTVDVAATKAIDLTLPLRNDPGRPHQWAASITDATFLFAEQHAELAPPLEDALAGVGRAALRAQGGPTSDLTLQQIDGGADAKYVVASNDTFVKTQADWRELVQKVTPVGAGENAFLYDLTDERAMGRAAAFDCDMTRTTARVFGVFPREVTPPDLKCRQQISSGDGLAVTVGFNVTGVVPFHLSIVQPDGKEFFAGYRTTRRDQPFVGEFRIPATAPSGDWRVRARSQLDGKVTTVPVVVKAAKAVALARPLDEPVVVREKAVVEAALAPGATVWLPLFANQQELTGVADAIRSQLKTRGVNVEVKSPPTIETYTRGYALTDEARAVNEKVERGEAIGRVQRLTLNGNDWFGDSRFKAARSMILLHLAGRNDNEIVDAFAGTLWPQATRDMAVIEGVAWAFGPEKSAVVISADSVDSMQKAVERLTRLPDDFLTAGVRDARSGLFRELGIGGNRLTTDVKDLTAKGATTQARPEPFVMKIGDGKPYPSDQKPIAPTANERVVPVPSLPVTKDFTAKVRSRRGYLSAFVYGAEFDLRFNDALSIQVNVPETGPVALALDGVFRYSDRVPCTAPQWEDIIAIRQKYMTGGRLPISIDVLLDGRPIGKLDQLTTGERDVQLELYAPGGGKPKTAKEEVVTTIAGNVDLPKGEHSLLFVHHNIVDGAIARFRLGLTPEQADAIEAQRQAAALAEKQRIDAEKKRAADEKKRIEDEKKRQDAELKKQKEAESKSQKTPAAKK